MIRSFCFCSFPLFLFSSVPLFLFSSFPLLALASAGAETLVRQPSCATGDYETHYIGAKPHQPAAKIRVIVDPALSEPHE